MRELGLEELFHNRDRAEMVACMHAYRFSPPYPLEDYYLYEIMYQKRLHHQYHQLTDF